MSDDQVLDFQEAMVEARIEAGQCIWCGSSEDTTERPLKDLAFGSLAHEDCNIMATYPTQDDFDREAVRLNVAS